MSNYFDPLAIHINGVSDGYFIFTSSRNSGICIYRYDPQRMIHHYEIKNDDIG